MKVEEQRAISDTLWHSPVSALDCPVVIYHRPAGDNCSPPLHRKHVHLKAI